MQNEFFDLISSLISGTSYFKPIDTAYEMIDQREMDTVYNMIVDKLVHNIFFETVGDELLLSAFEKLPRLEKIIVVFHIMLNYSASDVAAIADTTSSSIHTQKYKALRRLRKALNIK